VNPNDPAKRNPTDTTRTDTTKTETTRPDSTRTDASNPAWQGWAGTGASSFADQPMVFVAMRGAALAPSATSTSTERNPNSPVTTPPPASFATSTQGEAYVLLCNHNDPTSRSAFSKVQSFGPGAASSSSSDRVQVSGKDETDATRRSEDPARQPATDRSTSQDYKPYAPKYGQGVLKGKLIKVSGRILSRGGIQAIEVTSIDDTSPTSTSSPDATSIK
jgi:hypothetical protein